MHVLVLAPLVAGLVADDFRERLQPVEVGGDPAARVPRVALQVVELVDVEAVAAVGDQLVEPALALREAALVPGEEPSAFWVPVGVEREALPSPSSLPLSLPFP